MIQSYSHSIKVIILKGSHANTPPCRMDVFKAPAYLVDLEDVNFSDDEEDMEQYVWAALPIILYIEYCGT